MDLVKEIKKLTDNALKVICQRIDEIGSESKFTDDQCIVIINEDFNYNLDGSRYLHEVTKKCLHDNNGYEYNYEILSIEQLINLAEHLKKI